MKRKDKTATPAIKVQFFWTTMDCPPTLDECLSEPFLTGSVDGLPAPGDKVRFALERPVLPRQTAPSVWVRATVMRVEPQADGYHLYLKQIPKNCFTFAELHARLGQVVHGYHPDFGIVQGLLVGLSPVYQLALLSHASLEAYLEAVNETDKASDEPPTIAVDWSSIVLSTQS